MLSVCDALPGLRWARAALLSPCLFFSLGVFWWCCGEAHPGWADPRGTRAPTHPNPRSEPARRGGEAGGPRRRRGQGRFDLRQHEQARDAALHEPHPRPQGAMMLYDFCSFAAFLRPWGAAERGAVSAGVRWAVFGAILAAKQRRRLTGEGARPSVSAGGGVRGRLGVRHGRRPRPRADPRRGRVADRRGGRKRPAHARGGLGGGSEGPLFLPPDTPRTPPMDSPRTPHGPSHDLTRIRTAAGDGWGVRSRGGPFDGQRCA